VISLLRNPHLLGNSSDPGDVGRITQYKIGLQFVFSDFTHVLVGGRISENVRIGDVTFSDNSFIFLALEYGVPLTLLWIGVVLTRIVPLRISTRIPYLLTLLFLYWTFFTTPSLFWDLWLVYAVALLFVAPDLRETPMRETRPLRAVPPKRMDSLSAPMRKAFVSHAS
jgi:hypothetical protein